MKLKKIMILIFAIIIPIITIICFVISLHTGNVEATAAEIKNEQELVNMVASLSAIKDSNNEYNAERIQEEINKYIGEGVATVTESSGTIYVTYAKTGNQYPILGNSQYTITYNLNGGTGSFENQTKKHGYRIALLSNECTRTGYTFMGWDTDSSAVTVKYKPGETFMENGNTTLYAVWTQKPTIKYDANGGTGAPETQIKEPGTSITLSSATPTRTGYTFKGWSTSSTATVPEYEAGAAYTAEGNKTLYAVWNENYLTVNYYSNYATASFTDAENTVSGSTNVLVRTHKFYYDDAIPNGLHNYSSSTAGTYLGRTGYNATGYWGTSTSGGTKVSEAAGFDNSQALAQAFGKDLTNGNASINVYAQWTAKTIVVTFNKNDGSGTTATQTFTYGVSGQSFSNKNWTRSGYTLLGWATSSTATTTNYSTLSGVSNDWINTNSPSITLYAVWKTVEINLFNYGNTGYTWVNGKNLTQNTDNLYVGVDGWAYTSTKIDLTNMKTLSAFVQVTYEEGIEMSLAVFSSMPTAIPEGGWTTSQAVKVNTKKPASYRGDYYETFMIDVSDLTGSYYIAIGHRGLYQSKWYKVQLSGITDDSVNLFNYSDPGRAWYSGLGMVRNSDNLHLCVADSWGYTLRKVDLTNFTTLKAYTFLQTNYGGNLSLAVFSSTPTQIPDGGWTTSQAVKVHTKAYNADSTGHYETLSVDVSNLTGSYYIAIGHRGYAGSKWYKVWLE